MRLADFRESEFSSQQEGNFIHHPPKTPNMLKPEESAESRISVVLEAVVTVALKELRTLLQKCTVQNLQSPAQTAQTAAQTAHTRDQEQQEAGEDPPEERHHFITAITSKFASLLTALTKVAVEKILIMWNTSACEAEGSAAAEPRPGQGDRTQHTSTKPKAGRAARLKKEMLSRRSKNREKTVRGPKKGVRQEKDHMYCREGKQPEAPSSSSSSSSSSAAAGAAAAAAAVAGPADDSHAPSGPGAESGQCISALTRRVQPDPDISAAAPKVKKRAPPGPYKCPCCDKSFIRKCMLDRHYRSHSKPHRCTECGKRFSGLPGLAAHARRHTGEKLYRCSDCGTEFAYKSTFHRHMRQHGRDAAGGHACGLCEKRFDGLPAFQRHRCCALQQTFTCSLCPETFQSRQSLADHENLHPGDREFVCEVCGQGFFTSSSLAAHRVTHVQKENSDPHVLRDPKLLSCQVCGRGLSHQSALKHHMLTHTGERPYMCETCGKRCGHASALQNHMRTHTGRKAGQRPECATCGKKFSCAVNLKYHMSVHTGERPYACDQCGKTFSNPSNLKLHGRVHSGQKTHSCSVCGRKFSQSSSLKVHRRLHTGERPHGCGLCGLSFRSHGELKKHRVTHLKDGDAAAVEKH